VYIFAPSVIRTLVIDHQIFEVFEEPFVWYERPWSLLEQSLLFLRNVSAVYLYTNYSPIGGVLGGRIALSYLFPGDAEDFGHCKR
jgi:hypothetical protein